jgi:hypothetical protein
MGFLLPFALDAKRGDWPRLQPISADIIPAGFTHAKVAVLNPLQSFPDLKDQLSLPISDAKHKVPVRLKRRSIGWIGECLLGVRHAGDSLLGFLEQLIQPGKQDFSEFSLDFFFHASSPTVF